MNIEITGEHNCITDEEISSIVNSFYSSFEIDNSKTVEIQFVTQEEIKVINYNYRNINEATDVLSFPQAKEIEFNQIFGTIIICLEKAIEYNEDCRELIKHGLLHLAGYDHESNIGEWKTAAIKINHNMGIE